MATRVTDGSSFRPRFARLTASPLRARALLPLNLKKKRGQGFKEEHSSHLYGIS